MHSSTRWLLLALAMLAVPGSLSAQQAAASSFPVDSGARVRVRVAGSSQQVVGVLTRASGDTLVVRNDHGTDTWVPRAQVVSVDRSASRGPTLRRIAIGAGIGMIAGGTLGNGIGGVVGNANCEQCDDLADPDDEVMRAQRRGLVIGGAIGAVAGAVFMAARPGDRWQEVYRAERVSLVRTRRGPALAFTF